jgi:3-hydroxyisobutyrate dehydrogenase-like beta-hydroxyacid dehydrogenase
MRLAFLGLGQMGAPMARRLLDAGHDVAVWNRTGARADPLVQAGARRAASPRESGADVDAAFTMLANSEAVDEVLFGTDGLVSGLAAEATVVEMSTVGPEAVRRAAGRLPPGMEIIDAPVLGSIPQATEGALSIFVGGTPEQFERWRAVLEAMGRPRHVGPLGAGAAMKLVANSTLGALMTGLGEALALADGLGPRRQTCRAIKMKPNPPALRRGGQRDQPCIAIRVILDRAVLAIHRQRERRKAHQIADKQGMQRRHVTSMFAGLPVFAMNQQALIARHVEYPDTVLIGAEPEVDVADFARAEGGAVIGHEIQIEIDLRLAPAHAVLIAPAHFEHAAAVERLQHLHALIVCLSKLLIVGRIEVRAACRAPRGAVASRDERKGNERHNEDGQGMTQMDELGSWHIKRDWTKRDG